MPRIRPRWWPLLLVAIVLVLVALVARRQALAAPASFDQEVGEQVEPEEGRQSAAEEEQAAAEAEQSATETARDLQNDLQVAIDTRQETQQLREAWDEEQAALIARYRELQGDVDYLAERRDVERARLAALEERNAELQRRLRESDRLQESLEDTLRRVVEHLEEAVAADLPFLSEERTARLRDISAELARPETDIAEKLRRVLEALLVEAQYGSTVEVYRDRIVAAGDTLHADVLRLGSLALFWRTPDGSRTGHFDIAGGAWAELPSRYDRAVRRAMEMATRRRPVEIIGLPLGEVAP